MYILNINLYIYIYKFFKNVFSLILYDKAFIKEDI